MTRCDRRRRLTHSILLAAPLTLGTAVTPARAQAHREQNEPRREAPSRPTHDPMNEPLVTDRPDFTESTDAVPAGHVQLELGYTFTYDREGNERLRTQTPPELLVRVGIVDNLELRIGWDGYTLTEQSVPVERSNRTRFTDHDWSQGSNDLSLGIKYKFFEQHEWRPHFGVIAGVSVPSGSAILSSGDVDPELVLLWAYDLSDTTALAGNVGFAAPTDAGDRFFQATASLSVAASLTDRLGAYIEYFGIYPNAEHTDCAHSANGGLTYLINNNLQLDWRIGAGLNEEADDFFTGFGIAWRF